MTSPTDRAVPRVLKEMARPPRRRPRFTLASFTLALALALGFVLVNQLVPRIWAATLPGGVAQAQSFRGIPGLIWALSLDSHRNPMAMAAFGTMIVLVGWLASALFRPLRWLVWLAAIAAILGDAGILYVALQTSWLAAAGPLGLTFDATNVLSF